MVTFAESLVSWHFLSRRRTAHLLDKVGLGKHSLIKGHNLGDTCLPPELAGEVTEFTGTQKAGEIAKFTGTQKATD